MVKKKSNKKNIAGSPKLLNREIKSDKKIAMDFAEKVQRKFDRIVKASILFGSQATAKDKASV